MKRRFLIFFWAFAVFLGACGLVRAAEEAQAVKSMTVMVYMVGSDLETSAASATLDMEEMADAGVDLTRSNVVICTGGAKRWHSDIPSDVNAVMELTEAGFIQRHAFELQSMGDPDTLSRFLNYAYETYPAREYMLILWDHGNGPLLGYGADKLYKNDALTLIELQEALDASPFGPENHLSLIGFDACLMASAELACVLSDYADYLIASQETEPSFGWNYAFMKDCGREDTLTLAESIIDTYQAYCEAYFEENTYCQAEVTLSVLDLSCARELALAIDALFSSANAYVSGDYNKYAAARVNTRALGRASTGSEYDLVDLESMAREMNEYYPQEAQALQQVLSRMVTYFKTNASGLHGLSLYYPYYNKKYYQKSWSEIYAGMGVFPEYVGYLSRFSEIWLGTDMQDYFGENLEAREDAGSFHLQLTPEQREVYTSGGYYILRRESSDLYAIVYSSSNVTLDENLLTANWDGRIIYYSNKWDDKGIPVTIESDHTEENTYYRVLVILNDYDSEQELHLMGDQRSGEIQLAVDHETGEVTVKGIYAAQTDEADEFGNGKREEVDLKDFDVVDFMNVSARYLTRDEKGRIIDFFSWPESGLITWMPMAVEDEIGFTYERIYEDGYEYFIMFRVNDGQNHSYYSELLPIHLQEAPADIQEYEIIEDSMKDGKALLYSGNGLTLELLKVRSLKDGTEKYVFHFENTNDFDLYVSLSEPVVNEVYAGSRSTSLFLESRSSGYKEFKEIAEICRLNEIRSPETIETVIDVKNWDTTASLTRNDHVRVKVIEEPCDFVKVPVLDLSANEQVLFEEEGVRIVLKGAGNYLGCEDYGDPLSLYLQYENHSQETVRITALGVSLNGYQIAENSSMTLIPEGISYKKMTFYGLPDKLKGVGIDGLNSLQLHFEIRIGEKTIYAAPLAVPHTAGSQNEPEITGTRIYEDENFVLYSGEDTVDQWNEEYVHKTELILVNKTGNYLNIALTDPTLNGLTEEEYGHSITFSEFGLFGYSVLFDTLRFYWKEETLPSAEFGLKVSALDVEAYETPRIQIGCQYSDFLSEESDSQEKILFDGVLISSDSEKRQEAVDFEDAALAQEEYCLYESEELTITLYSSMAVDTSSPVFSVEVENRSEEEMTVRLSNFVLQDRVCSDASAYIPVDANSMELYAIRDLPPELLIFGIRELTKLSCDMRITNSDYEVIHKERMMVEEPAGFRFDLKKVAYLGNKADEQVLLSDESVCLELIGLGCYLNESGSYSLRGILRAQNLSAHTIPVKVSGISINGQSFSVTSTLTELPPGKINTNCFEVPLREMESAEIGYMKTVSLLILSDMSTNTGIGNYDGGNWYDLELEDSNYETGDHPDFSGTLLYDEGGIRVYYQGMEATGHTLRWNVTLVNETEENVDIRLRDEAFIGAHAEEFDAEKLYLSHGELGSGTYRSTYLSLNLENPEAFRCSPVFKLQITTLGGSKFIALSDEIRIPME